MYYVKRRFFHDTAHIINSFITTMGQLHVYTFLGSSFYILVESSSYDTNSRETNQLAVLKYPIWDLWFPVKILTYCVQYVFLSVA